MDSRVNDRDLGALILNVSDLTRSMSMKLPGISTSIDSPLRESLASLSHTTLRPFRSMADSPSDVEVGETPPPPNLTQYTLRCCQMVAYKQSRYAVNDRIGLVSEGG